jgi:uncharacterized protein (TIGR02145 family)
MNRLKYLLVLIIWGALITEKGTVPDFEGNVYNTVLIGNQWWMSDNLRATKYNNGDQIGTTVPNSLSIVDATSPKYNWPYMGNESFAAIYGRLYTWYAVSDLRNVCPAGWHVPSDGDWKILTDYVVSLAGGGNTSAKALSATEGWILYGIVGNPGNDQAGNNISGFSAMPGGMRQPAGSFSQAGAGAYYWSTTGDIPGLASYKLVYFDMNTMQEGNMTKETGLSVRCIKD